MQVITDIQIKEKINKIMDSRIGLRRKIILIQQYLNEIQNIKG